MGAGILMTSKLPPLTVLRVLSSSLFQRGSGAPVMNQLLPLSARIMPYFFRPLRMTWADGGKPPTSKAALRRTRIPMGGRPGLVLVLAKGGGGEATQALRV